MIPLRGWAISNAGPAPLSPLAASGVKRFGASMTRLEGDGSYVARVVRPRPASTAKPEYRSASRPAVPPPARPQGNAGGDTRTQRRVRVVLADNERVLREGLRLILGAAEGIEIVGDSPLNLQASEVIGTVRPDVGLLHVTTLGRDDLELIRTISERHRETKLLVLTSVMEEAIILKALKAGAKGCLSREASVADLVKAIHVIDVGELWVERRLMARLLEGEGGREGSDQGRSREGLTVREQEVLKLLVSGLANKDIAQSLVISERTVKTHLNNIFRKINVTRRLEAVLYAIRKGLGRPSSA